MRAAYRAASLRALVRPLFAEPHPTRRRALIESFGLVVLCLVHTSLFVIISYAQRDFSTALSKKDWPGFVASCWKFAGVIAVAAPSFAYYQYLQAPRFGPSIAPRAPTRLSVRLPASVCSRRGSSACTHASG